MIAGIGTDLVPLDRLRQARKARGFDRRVFTAAELRHARRFRDADERLAARFAAKEAVLKALGTGWAKGIAWSEVETLNGAEGRPALRLKGKALKQSKALGIRRWHLSLSHAGGCALAFVVAET